MSVSRRAYACRHALPAAAPTPPPPPQSRPCINPKTTGPNTTTTTATNTRTRPTAIKRSRQTVLPSSFSPPLNHIWISDDLLASIFRRFNHAQRRYGSQVPGPLEARRRLARRRNTAFAAASSFDPAVLAQQQQLDMAALFGRNGREHNNMMKWGDGGGLGGAADLYPSWPLSVTEPFAAFDPFDGFSGMPNEEAESLAKQSEEISTKADAMRREQDLEQFLRRTRWKIADVREAVWEMEIDPRQDREYSRLIFANMLVESKRRNDVTADLIAFLDDPFLNPPAVENYAAAVKHLCACRANAGLREALLAAVCKALELGTISNQELVTIVKLIPDIRHGKSVLGRRASTDLVRCYKALWEAIGRCRVLGYKDVSRSVIETMLATLAEASSRKSALFLARDIIKTARAHGHRFSAESWTAALIVQWLDLNARTAQKDPRIFSKGVVPFSGNRIDSDFIRAVLQSGSLDETSRCVIDVTEAIASSSKEIEHTQMMYRLWREFLTGHPDLSTLTQSAAWFDLQSNYTGKPAHTTLSGRRRILLRLWALQSLIESSRQSALWKKREPAINYTCYNLLQLFTSLRRKTKRNPEETLLADLLQLANALDLPINGVLTLVVDLHTAKRSSTSTRQAFEKLESLTASFPDVFMDLDSYNALKPHCYSVFDKFVQQIHITGPSFIEQSLQLAESGQSEDLWTLIRILRSHIAFKIALSHAWRPRAEPSQKALVRLSSARFPDPHAAVDLVNWLAAAFARNPNISPRRAVHLVHWLYAFLKRHNAPVGPILVRALYFAHVHRYRREGLKVSQTRLRWLYSVVRAVEGPEVVEQLKWEGLT